jgi:Asp-tRNA(Asn)/Glu-tRNA(Gln) amidotransferase A subunit family amidase
MRHEDRLLTGGPQIVGRRLEDATVLHLAHGLEHAIVTEL